MGVFKLMEFEQNRHLTMIMDVPQGLRSLVTSQELRRSSDYREYLSPCARGSAIPGTNTWMRWFLPWRLVYDAKQF